MGAMAVTADLPRDVEKAITKDCYLVMRDVLGDGYVQDYYLSEASGFIFLAESWYRRGVEAGRAER
jgi:hypothetical protein